MLAAFIGLGGVSTPSRAQTQAEEVWLLVDTSALTLSVMQGEQILQTYQNIAIGSNGTTREKIILDQRTPLGDFTINGIRPSTRFHRFLSIDYPNMKVAGLALLDDRISLEEYDALRDAWDNGEQPPQQTAIGGYLGIHGLGRGDLEVHSAVNWTDGCVALTNEEINDLAEWVAVGTRISIR